MPRRTARLALLVTMAVLTLGAATAPAADAPSLGTGRFVIYVGQLGGSRGCGVDRQLAARLRTAVRGQWLMPGVGPGDRTGHPYAVCVDAAGKVWLTDFSTNTLQRFDPETERFQAYRIPTTDSLVRQIVEVGGVIWGAESATEKLVALRPAGQLRR